MLDHVVNSPQRPDVGNFLTDKKHRGLPVESNGTLYLHASHLQHTAHFSETLVGLIRHVPHDPWSFSMKGNASIFLGGRRSPPAVKAQEMAAEKGLINRFRLEFRRDFPIQRIHFTVQKPEFDKATTTDCN